jgi:hypothetical protein
MIPGKRWLVTPKPGEGGWKRSLAGNNGKRQDYQDLENRESQALRKTTTA